MLCWTWQRPQIPRPPHTESISTPSRRAASRTVVPVSNRPRRPDGVKMTSASSVTTLLLVRSAADGGTGLGTGPAPIDPSATDVAVGRADAMGPDPARRILVVALENVRGHDGGPDAFGDRIGDRARQARGNRHRQERAVDSLPVRQSEADVAGAAGRV